MKGICFLAKKRFGGFHDLFFIQSNLSESEVIRWLASVLVHEARSDRKRLD